MVERHKRVINKYKNRLFRLQHVIGVGYGIKEKSGERTGEEAIIIMVDKKMPKENLHRKDLIPLKLHEYKTDVQELGYIQFLQARTTRVRPAQPGVSVGHYEVTAGTLGAIVNDIKTDQPLILSNNHVLANRTNGHDGRAKVGDEILQPGVYDDGKTPDDLIGHLERFIPLNSNIDSTTCPIASEVERIANNFLHSLRPDYDLKLFKQTVGNKVDCALAKPVNNDMINSNVLGIGKVKGVTDPEIDMEVIKSGRTSGVTTGKIKSIHSTVQVNLSENEVATFTDQFITEPISKAGDSGSLVLDRQNRAVGLLFAGSDQATICNDIKNVMEALSIEFY